MIRDASSSGVKIAGAPRVSGDDPEVGRINEKGTLCSPRERG